MTLYDSIVANDTPGNFVVPAGTVNDGGHNLSSDSSFALAGPGSLNHTDPLLGPLANNGGPTPTMALLPGSPAVDAGDPAFCLAADQRGVAPPHRRGVPTSAAFEGSRWVSAVASLGIFRREA